MKAKTFASTQKRLLLSLEQKIQKQYDAWLIFFPEGFIVNVKKTTWQINVIYSKKNLNIYIHTPDSNDYWQKL